MMKRTGCVRRLKGLQGSMLDFVSWQFVTLEHLHVDVMCCEYFVFGQTF